MRRAPRRQRCVRTPKSQVVVSSRRLRGQAIPFHVRREPQRALRSLALAGQLCAQLLLRGQVHLVARGEDLLVVLGQGDLRHGVVLLGAEDDADGLRPVLRALEPIEEVHVHLHLAEVLVRERAELEIDEHEAAEQAVVEDEVDVEVIALERHALLPRDEAEAFAQLKEERLEAIDDGLLEVALAPVRPLVEVEEFEHEGVLQHVGGHLDFVSAPREREDLVLVAALRQALEEERRNLPLQLAAGPALSRGLDLVERARRRIRHPEQHEVVRPAEVRRKGRRHTGRFGQRCCPNLFGLRFGQRCCPFRRPTQLGRQRGAFGVGNVEPPDAPKRSSAEALAHAPGKAAAPDAR